MTTYAGDPSKRKLFTPATLDDPHYDPEGILSLLMKKLSLRNDAALSRALEVAPPVISKIRHRKTSVSGMLLVRMHQVSDISIGELTSAMSRQKQ